MSRGTKQLSLSWRRYALTCDNYLTRINDMRGANKKMNCRYDRRYEIRSAEDIAHVTLASVPTK